MPRSTILRAHRRGRILADPQTEGTESQYLWTTRAIKNLQGLYDRLVRLGSIDTVGEPLNNQGSVWITINIEGTERRITTQYARYVIYCWGTTEAR